WHVAVSAGGPLSLPGARNLTTERGTSRGAERRRRRGDRRDRALPRRRCATWPRAGRRAPARAGRGASLRGNGPARFAAPLFAALGRLGAGDARGAVRRDAPRRMGADLPAVLDRQCLG